MPDFWDRATELRMVRALDACCALLGDVADSVARRAVLQRLLTVLFEAGGGTDDPMSELYAATDVLTDTPAPTGLSDQEALLWLERAQRARTLALMHEVSGWAPYDAAEVDAHPMWRVHRLGALPRRLRLLAANTGVSATGLGRAAGLAPVRVGQWAAGRSRPGTAEREALAAAFAVHPGWLAEELDSRTPADWYVFEGDCPCDCQEPVFAQSPLDGRTTGIGALVEQGLWCAGEEGCGQPYLVDGDIFHPAPTLPDGYRERFAAATGGDQPSNCGPELSRPWPHALWNTPAGPQRRGPLRLPSVLARAPGSRW
ncbi:helix-turn-helix domain-containing protein [Kitasatospora sp. NPDC057542]|uniref:helix-turn-helix domain-containing protein n=1 Tax=Kitasatospora sp. NPDC057542 TaxID=3346162 RepID=UPI00369BD6FE